MLTAAKKKKQTKAMDSKYHGILYTMDSSSNKSNKQMKSVDLNLNSIEKQSERERIREILNCKKIVSLRYKHCLRMMQKAK